jgi:hypothetical protein
MADCYHTHREPAVVCQLADDGGGQAADSDVG